MGIREEFKKAMESTENEAVGIEGIKLSLVNKYEVYLCDVELPPFFAELLLEDFSDYIDELEDIEVLVMQKYGLFTIKKAYDEFFIANVEEI